MPYSEVEVKNLDRGMRLDLEGDPVVDPHHDIFVYHSSLAEVVSVDPDDNGEVVLTLQTEINELMVAMPINHRVKVLFETEAGDVDF